MNALQVASAFAKRININTHIYLHFVVISKSLQYFEINFLGFYGSKDVSLGVFITLHVCVFHCKEFLIVLLSVTYSGGHKKFGNASRIALLLTPKDCTGYHLLFQLHIAKDDIMVIYVQYVLCMSVRMFLFINILPPSSTRNGFSYSSH